MNTTNNTVTSTFASAVIDEIAQFAANKQEFSAYSLAQSIRTKANAGQLVVTDLQPVQMAGTTTYNIKVDDVRTLVKELFSRSLLKGFSKDDYRLNPANGQYYRVYLPDAVTDNNTSSNDNDNDVSAPVQTPVQVVAPLMAALATAPIVTPNVENKIVNYVRSRTQVGHIPSLKQVQSAVKVKGVFCSDILTICKNKGFSITPGNSISRTLVA